MIFESIEDFLKFVQSQKRPPNPHINPSLKHEIKTPLIILKTVKQAMMHDIGVIRLELKLRERLVYEIDEIIEGIEEEIKKE